MASELLLDGERVVGVIEKICRNCGRTFPQYNTTVTICALCAFNRYNKPRKPLKVRGKRTKEYDKWRRDIAVPYLDKTFSHQCSNCGRTDQLDIDHIKSRGAHPELRMELSNIQWLCRPCHQLKTDGILKI